MGRGGILARDGTSFEPCRGPIEWRGGILATDRTFFEPCRGPIGRRCGALASGIRAVNRCA